MRSTFNIKVFNKRNERTHLTVIVFTIWKYGSQLNYHNRNRYVFEGVHRVQTQTHTNTF